MPEPVIEPGQEQETELQRRLRRLNWPEPPPGARERGFESLRTHLDHA
jgi:hypothetical protein